MLVSPTPVRGRRRWSVIALAVALATGFTPGGSAGAAAVDPPAVSVTVNAREGLGVAPDTAYGLNQAVWDTNMNIRRRWTSSAGPVCG